MNRLPRFGVAARARIVAALAAGVTAGGCGSSTAGPGPRQHADPERDRGARTRVVGDPVDAALARPPRPGHAPAPGNGTTEDRAAVETVFRTYLRAVADGDFATACALNAPETNQRLLDELARRGTPAPTCETAIATLYAGSGVAQGAATIADTLSVERVDVDGDAATVAWSVEVSGRRPVVTNALRRIDGQWRLLPTPDPTG